MNRHGEWLRAYVEKCLREQWGIDKVLQDDDGDFCYRCGTAACYVRVEGGPAPLVRVFAHAVVDVKRSARLLVELNEVNERSRTAHAYWAGGAVIVEQALHPNGVEPEALGQACAAVGRVADDLGTLAAAAFDGRTPFPPDVAMAE